MSLRTRSRSGFQSSLNGSINNSVTTFDLVSAAGLVHPLYLVIDPDDPTKRENIKVGNVSSNTLSGVTRGLTGSAAGAVAHDAGAPVRAVMIQQHLDDIWDDIEAHVAGTDTADHPEATTGTRGFMSSSDKTKLNALDTAKQVTGGDAHDHAGGDGAQIAHSGLSGVTADQHHAQLHQAAHQSGGGDALTGNLNAVARTDVRKNSTGSVFSRRRLNFIESGGTVLTIADDAGAEEVDITISSSAGTTDHGALTGLSDDDHSLYHTDARALTWLNGRVLDDFSNVVLSAPANGEILKYNGTNWINNTLAEAAISSTSHNHSGVYAPLASPDFTGQVGLAAGSVSAPALALSANPDTGWWFSGTAGVYSVDGDETFRIVSQGTDLQTRISGKNSTSFLEFDHTNDFYQFYLTSVEIVRFENGGSASSVRILDGLSDVGNVETLRLNRGTGTGVAAIGYFSSRAAFKTDVKDLAKSPRFPGLGVIDLIRPVDFKRKSTKEREWGFLIDDFEAIDDNLKYLTTKGDKWGDSLDEFGLMAVAYLGIQDLRQRVAALEAA